MGRRSRHILIILSILCVAGLATFWPGRAAQARTPAQARPFVMGFLAEGSDLPQAAAVLEHLRLEMDGNTALKQALERAGYGEVLLLPSDGARDMAQRLQAGEFDLAFATSIILGLAGSETYQPILQTRLPGDIEEPGRGIMRQGVLIAGPTSPLYAIPPTNRDFFIRLNDELVSEPIAVPAADSGAGYIFPRLKIATDLGLRQPLRFWFCGNDREVIKHVVAGLVPLGACRAGELEALMKVPPNAATGPGFRVVTRTQFLPSDPILLRRTLDPATSDVGREMQSLLRAFFNRDRNAGDLRLEPVQDNAYGGMAEALRTFESILVESEWFYSPQFARQPPATRGSSMESTSTTLPAPKATIGQPALPTATPAQTPRERPVLPPLGANDAEAPTQ